MKLLSEFPALVVIATVCFLVAIVEKFVNYQNAILAKINFWSFSTLAIIIASMLFLTYHVAFICFKGVVIEHEIDKVILPGIILTFLMTTLIISVIGIILRMRNGFVENI